MRGMICLAAMLSPTLAGATTIQQFDVPGAATTCGSTISGDGLVTGYATGGTLAAGKAFLYKTATGEFRYPDPATAPGTVFFLGVTLKRAILVSDITSMPVGVNIYLYDHGTTTPLSGLLGNASAINDSGAIAGTTTVFPTGILGFVVSPAGTETTYDDGSHFVEPAAIDSSATRLVGFSGYGAFYYDGAHYTVLAAPGATLGTLARGVNRHGEVSGTYATGTSSAPIANGFLYRNGAYTTWNVPGAITTGINGINDAGKIVGCFTDSAGSHGFVATP